MARYALLSLLVALRGTAATPAPEGRPRLTVMEVTVTQGVDPQVAKGLTQALASEAQAIGTFEVSSATEVQAALGLERQRQLLGCSEDASACSMELAQALGARFALAGGLAKLGATWQLTLSMLDTQKGATAGRSTRLASSLDEIRSQLPWALAEATGTPPPRAPSRAVPYGLMIGGGLALAASGVLFLQSVIREQTVLTELKATGSTLRSASSFQDDAAQISQLRLIGAITAGVGAVALVTGVLVNPRSDAVVRVAVVPTLGGGALVGVFP